MRQSVIDRLPRLQEHRREQLMRDPPKGFFWGVAIGRLRLAVPERRTTLSRITRDHRIMGQIKQLGSQRQLVACSPLLGDVAVD
jgi:hypothetical protein